MVNTPGLSPKSARPKQPLVEERFWRRYSPHGELPLSGAGSFALHAQVVGGLVLMGFLGLWFTRPSRPLPIESVQVARGGGGNPAGVEGNRGLGHGPEAVANGEPNRQTGRQDEAPPRPDLARVEKQPPALQLKEGERVISLSPGAMRAFDRLNAAVRSKQNDGRPPGRGRAGPGDGGGTGTGTGPDKGPGRGRGDATLTKQHERMLRWTMHFNTRTGEDYVRQLRGLGAILAVPVKEGDRPDYRLIRDLAKRPAKLLDEDLSQIKRIYWIDDKPRSVQEVMSALQLRLRPSHFVAFMPEELEQKLLQLEKEYRGLAEDQIHETKFRIVEKNGRFEPQVIEQTPKR